MSNSPLVVHTNISPNRNSPRKAKIDTITIHCVVGQCGPERIGEIFKPAARRASSNYGVGKDGRIGMYCEEKDRSWCTSSASNDNRAITIEVASDNKAPYAVTDKAMEALIQLCADICKRNGIKKLLWKADKSLIGKPALQNMTVHSWFANKDCPGEYLYKRHGYIAEKVNAILDGDKPSPQPTTSDTDKEFTVRLKVSALNVRTGPGTNYQVATILIKDGAYHKIIREKEGQGSSMWGELSSGFGWIALDYVDYVVTE